MFMKHYAPNRCLYIKVAKLRTGVGSAEMSHLQNRSKYQGRCEQGSEVFVKSFFFSLRGGGGGGGVGVRSGGGGHRVDVNKVKKKKKMAGRVGGRGGSGWI